MSAFISILLGSNLTLGVISSLLGSISMIVYKKTLQGWLAGTNLFLLSGALIGLFASLGIAFFDSEFQFSLQWKMLLLLALVSILQQWNAVSLTRINTYEKISTVQIFGNIRTFMTLIAGFILFGNTSFVTLGIVILAAIVLFVSQYEKGSFQPPAAWKEMIITFGASSAIGLTHVWFIMSLGSLWFFVYSGILGLVIAIGFSLSRMGGELKNFNKITAKSAQIRTLDGLLFQGVRYVSFFLIKAVGPVVSTLLGMLGNITTLLFGAIYLKEKNTPKEWFVNILLCVLVGLGFYFK